MRLVLVLLLAGFAARQGTAQLTPAEAARQWEAARVFKTAPAVEDHQGAVNFQQALIEQLSAHLGRPVGYKAAMTHPQTQQMFGVAEPILGILLDKMLQADNAEFPLGFAARPAAEADLLVRVRDPNINEAERDLDLLAGLEAAIPFIELPDLLRTPAASNEVNVLIALNAGARAGVMGEAIALTPDQSTLDRLGSFSARLVNEDGQILGEGKGSELLGHPIHVVRWIRDAVKARGDTLRAGQLLSLGSVTPLYLIRKPVRLTAHYEGLTEDPVSVSCIIHEAAESE